MTCIVGVVEKGIVHIGGDSAGVGGYRIQSRLDPKVFKRGPFVIGFTSSFRMGQILQHKLQTPEHPASMDDFAFMVTRFIDNVRECLKNVGFASKSNEVEEGGTFLVGYRGKLYEIEGDYQVAMQAQPYAAVGCGQDLALGAMFALDPTLDPVARIRIALEAAERFSAGVSGPFNFVQSEPTE